MGRDRVHGDVTMDFTIEPLTGDNFVAWLSRVSYLRSRDDLAVWSLPCFYARRTHRGQGVLRPGTRPIAT